jgi:hypothetical protein
MCTSIGEEPVFSIVGSDNQHNNFLRSLGKYLPNHMASHPRRQSCSDYDIENGAR